MASIVAHIVYARKYFEKFEPVELDRDEFILGSVFPDIRRIDESISRKDTHLHFSPIDLNFKGLSSFEAGWKFHLYCDMKREEILNKKGFYKISGADDFANLSAKLLEDEIVYEKYNNWEKVKHYFNNPPEIETGIGVSKETFELWYALLANYVKRSPDSRAIHIFLSKQPKLAEKADSIVESMNRLGGNKRAAEMLGKVWEEIV